MQFELKSVKKNTQGRFVIVEALVQECPVLLINIYAPNKTNEATDFYENLRSTLLESDYDQDYKIVIGGDFNAPLNFQLDRYGSKTEKREVVTKIRELILHFNLVDIWRIRNPNKRRHTFKQKKPVIQRRLGGISNASGTHSVRVSAQGLSRSCCKLSPMKIPSSRLAAPGSPRMRVLQSSANISQRKVSR